MIRLGAPDIGEEEIDAVADVLRSGFLVQGRRVAEFEAAIRAVAHASEAVAVSNGTAALHLALLALGVGRGDLVAVPAYSWLSTANVVVLCGAVPVFVDIDPVSFNMDPDQLRDAGRKSPLRAVIPVHAFGAMAPMPRVLDAAGGSPVIEDAACALGAAVDGRPAGSWGTLGCFSFHPRKAVTTGEGGAVTSERADLARKIRILRNHGLDPDAPRPDFVAAGFNMRLTEFQAILGVLQLRKLDRLIAARVALAARYDALLAGSGVTTPTSAGEGAHIYQSYVVLLPKESASRRDDVIASLRAQGVETTIGTYHMPLTRYFRDSLGHRPGDFPVTDDVAARALALPIHTRLTDDDQTRVALALTAAI